MGRARPLGMIVARPVWGRAAASTEKAHKPRRQLMPANRPPRRPITGATGPGRVIGPHSFETPSRLARLTASRWELRVRAVNAPQRDCSRGTCPPATGTFPPSSEVMIPGDAWRVVCARRGSHPDHWPDLWTCGGWHRSVLEDAKGIVVGSDQAGEGVDQHETGEAAGMTVPCTCRGACSISSAVVERREVAREFERHPTRSAGLWPLAARVFWRDSRVRSRVPNGT